MNIASQHIAELEWSNYAATMPIAGVTPDLEVCLSQEVIITSSRQFPYPDSTHACLVRTTPETVDPLINQIIAYFKARELPTTIFVSPACTPADLGDRLLKRGFHKNETEEAWLVFSELLRCQLPAARPEITVEAIAKQQTGRFVSTMMAAFEIPDFFAPYLVGLTEPSVGLPTVCHYLAWLDGQPVGTASLVCHGQLGTLGGVGVAPAYRTRGVATNLILKVFSDAQTRGLDTILIQTGAATPLERLLRIHGFKRVFTRVAYGLPEQLG
jgi:GNAT superfamily N-acetyltransferase